MPCKNLAGENTPSRNKDQCRRDGPDCIQKYAAHLLHRHKGNELRMVDGKKHDQPKQCACFRNREQKRQSVYGNHASEKSTVMPVTPIAPVIASTD